MIKVFEDIIRLVNSYEEDYLALKEKVSSSPHESSIGNILNNVFNDIKKIIELKVI